MLNTILALDHSVLASIVAHRDESTAFFFYEVTQLGSVVALFSVGTAIALILALKYRWAEVAGLAIALGGTALASTTIKALVARPRPDIAYAVYPETGYSFPSEHTALTTACVIFLVYLIFRLTRNRAIHTINICIGLILIISVALSRLYLGVHYPSDVAGGLLLGALMATIGIIVERSFEHIQHHRF